MLLEELWVEDEHPRLFKCKWLYSNIIHISSLCLTKTVGIRHITLAYLKQAHCWALLAKWMLDILRYNNTSVSKRRAPHKENDNSGGWKKHPSVWNTELNQRSLFYRRWVHFLRERSVVVYQAPKDSSRAKGKAHSEPVWVGGVRLGACERWPGSHCKKKIEKNYNHSKRTTLFKNEPITFCWLS